MTKTTHFYHLHLSQITDNQTMTETMPLAPRKYDYKVDANRTITLEIAYTIEELPQVLDSSTMTMGDWDKIATKIQNK